MKKKFSEIIRGQDCLYRYRVYEDKSLKALEENRLYFSKPIYFNDPYDNLIYVDSEKVISDILCNIFVGMDSYLESRKNYENPAFKIADHMWHNKKTREWMIGERKKQVYSAIHTVRIKIKQNAKRFNDEGQGIDNHTVLSKVRYVTQQVDMTDDVLEYVRHNMSENMGDVPRVDASILSRKLRQVITEKSIDWAYENEWRLIPEIPRIETESPLAYIECKPLAVNIGSQCFGEKRENLINLCSDIKVPVFGMFLKENDPSCYLELNDDGNLELEHHEYFYYYRECGM